MPDRIVRSGGVGRHPVRNYHRLFSAPDRDILTFTRVSNEARFCFSRVPYLPDRQSKFSASLRPLAVTAVALLLWYALSAAHVFRAVIVPSPGSVVRGFVEQASSGRLLDDIVASLLRVTVGFTLALMLGVPAGLALGLSATARATVLPHVNFFRSLSSLAWIPFAIAWFGIGDASVIFLIFLGTFFSLVMAVCAAVANIPGIYFRAAADYGIRGIDLLTRVTLPAVMPQLITSVRMLAGLAWVVVVAAEMVAAGSGGLGYAIYDARNGMRNDIVVVEMIVIGSIGVLLDRVLLSLTHLPSVRWGYER